MAKTYLEIAITNQFQGWGNAYTKSLTPEEKADRFLQVSRVILNGAYTSNALSDILVMDKNDIDFSLTLTKLEDILLQQYPSSIPELRKIQDRQEVRKMVTDYLREYIDNREQESVLEEKTYQEFLDKYTTQLPYIELEYTDDLDTQLMDALTESLRELFKITSDISILKRYRNDIHRYYNLWFSPRTKAVFDIDYGYLYDALESEINKERLERVEHMKKIITSSSLRKEILNLK